MKKYLIVLLMALCLPILLAAQDEPEKKVVKLYGFLKGDAVYSTANVYSWGGTSNTNLGAPQLADTFNYSAAGFTAQHTRFGIKVSQGGDVKVGGKLELDFYGGGFDANIKPRIRQAYASIAKGGFEARFGQQWDIFSPINASTNNTNGNMWYAGNRGFRRGQIQLIYKIDPVKIQFAVCEATKEKATGGLGADNLSGIPMIQGRISAKLAEKYSFGAYVANASFKPDPTADTLDFTAFGFGLDVNMAFHKYFNLKGEFNMGTNLNNCNLFNIAGSGSFDDDRKSMGIWLNAVSKIHKNFHLVVGFGMDMNQTDSLAAGKVESNTVVYGDLVFPMANKFSLALEIMSITTALKDDDVTGIAYTDGSALVINLSGKLGF